MKLNKILNLIFLNTVLLKLSALGTIPVSESNNDAIAESIPLSELGAIAGAQYSGDGLAVVKTGSGALLRCIFQQLEGEVTREGLWLTSTVTNDVSDRFCVKAAMVGRVTPRALISADVTGGEQWIDRPAAPLAETGSVTVNGQSVRFMRPGLNEDYSVSVDGVRQDFVVLEKPAGRGELMVRLAVTGAQVEQTGGGVRLVLTQSRRRINYSRLHVTDANGRELPARMAVASLASVAVVVNDLDAVYPIRIDPTFSDASWSGMGGVLGVDGLVSASAVDDAGNLYIGGLFTVAGDTTANNIAKWDGSSWSALGSGMNGEVRALAVAGNNVYAGGTFTTAGGIAANHIAKWDGTNWSALGSGMNGFVRALSLGGGYLHAGGDFTTAGGDAASFIARWGGSSWSAIGSGVNGSVHALASAGSVLFVGGEFTTAGGNAANGIALWTGFNWGGLGSGLAGGSAPHVGALAIMGNDLYAGGIFTTAGGNPARNLAKWSGGSWSQVGGGVNSLVTSLAVSGNDLYVGGTLYEVYSSGGVTNQVNNVAKWNGTNWSTMDSGAGTGGLFFSFVTTLTVSGGDLYAGGWFAAASGIPAGRIARFHTGSNSWSAVGLGAGGDETMNGVIGGRNPSEPFVAALAVLNTNVYAGGHFTTMGGSAADYIATWDGHNWSALPRLDGQFPPVVQAFAVSGDEMYAGGMFFGAYGTTDFGFVARWNGSSWTYLPPYEVVLNVDKFTPRVFALAVSGSNVYAGGRWPDASAPETLSKPNRIIKWDGNNWSSVGSNLNHTVNALVATGSNLYAGGFFSSVTNSGGGSVTANYIARWDGNNWSALASEVNNAVYALAESGSNLYAGGSFTMAGGNPANRIARWDGASWSALGLGMNAPVYAIAFAGSDLYAGGAFTIVTNADGGIVAANRIAKWDGSSWSALGSGVAGRSVADARALTVLGSNLYAGGYFTIAGGQASAYVAKWTIPTVAFKPDTLTVSNGTFSAVVTGSVSNSVVVDRSATLTNWTPVATNILPAGGWQLTFPTGTNALQFYRARFGP